MTAQRELSMQPAAIRKRRQRDADRQRLVAPAEPASTPVTPAAPPVTPVTQPPPAPPSVTLLETEVVTGDGADAYAAPVAIGADDQGAGGVPLVEEAAPAPPPPISDEERRRQAQLVAKAITAYVGFGWGVLASQNHELLAGLADTFARGTPELDALTPDQKIAAGMSMALAFVNDSALAVALKYNIRIPYQDEGVVGISVGTATLGVIRAFKAPKNENERVRDAKDANPAPPPSQSQSQSQPPTEKRDRSRPVTRDVPPTEPHDDLAGTQGEPTVRAAGRGGSPS